MNMSFRWPFLLLIALPVSATAGEQEVTYSIVPANPRAGDLIRFRMDVVGCFGPYVEVQVRQEPREVDVLVHAPDFCDSNDPASTQTPRFSDVGVLPAGAYTIRIYDCGGPVPPPLPACALDRVEVLVIEPTVAAPAVIPALSKGGIAALLSMAAALGLLSLRQR